MRNDTKLFLKRSFLYFLLATTLLAIQFFFYLWRSPQADSMDFGGWLFYLGAVFSHAAMWMILPWLLAIAVWRVSRCSKLSHDLHLLLSSFLHMLAFVNGEVYLIYKFHINGFILSMVFGEDAGDIFTFDTWLYVKVGALLLAILLGNIVLQWVVKRQFNRLNRVHYLPVFLIWLAITLSSQLFHAYAAVVQKPSVIRAGMHLPYYFPLTANRLMLNLGVVSPEEFITVETNVESAAMNYPHEPIEAVSTDSLQRKNLVLIVIDSWNYRTYSQLYTPSIYQFAQTNRVYTDHLSSNNGTRAGIFGLFFSMPPLYWRDCEILGLQPVMIEEMLRQNYQIRIYPSANIVNPPFAKVMFSKVPYARNRTEGKTAYDRDCRITSDFIQAIDTLAQDENPFFSFLFYDLPHAFQLPKEKLNHFKPSWEFADYMKLNNELDPTPFYNLYRNCVYETDSLVGCVLQKLKEKELLDNTVVMITGDHGQEFNENHQNYWGHGGNYSPIQLRVPLIVHYPGDEAGVSHYRTTHYDFVPTVMKRILGVTTPMESYSRGQLLNDSTPRPWHVVGDYMDYAFILDDYTILEKRPSGTIEICDSLLRPIPGYKINTKLLDNAIRSINQFYKE